VKTLGVVGGIAPASTVEYYRTLIETYRARVPDGSAPPILINSIDLQRMLTLIGIDALDEVTVYLADELEKLVRAGAEIGLFASNTPHIVFDAIQRRVSIPLISIVDVTYDAAKAMGLTRVALLGTRFTMQGPAYSRVFVRGGIEVVVPDAADLEYVHDKYMGELVSGLFLPETRAGILAVVERLRTRQRVDGVILGGTELPLLIRDASNLEIPFLDTGKIHVEAAIDRMLSS
jgi:aspartate racemase